MKVYKETGALLGTVRKADIDLHRRPPAQDAALRQHLVRERRKAKLAAWEKALRLIASQAGSVREAREIAWEALEKHS